MTDSVYRPKILYWDIETSLKLATVFNTGKQVIRSDQLLEAGRIITLAYKWKGDDKAYVMDWGLEEQNDREILQHFSECLEQCDVAVAHYGNNFDVKFFNGRLLYHKLPPMTCYTTEDTCLQARRNFKIDSCSLNYLGQYLGVGEKQPHEGIDMWKKVQFDKDPVALQNMKDYNIQDVVLLEKVHSMMIPYIKSPSYNMATIRFGKTGAKGLFCPACGHPHITETDTYYFAKVYAYPVYRCDNCQHQFRGRKAFKYQDKDKELR